MEFPQILIKAYNIHKSYKNDYNEWCNEFIKHCIEEKNKEEVNIIFATKGVHRDTTHQNNFEYYGQFKKRSKDKIFDEIINKEKPSYYFKSDSISHTCYKITDMQMIQPRTSREPPKYKFSVEKMQETYIIKNNYPDYFNNTYRHPTTRIKLTSLAKYGFVPQNAGNLDSGIVKAYKITM